MKRSSLHLFRAPLALAVVSCTLYTSTCFRPSFTIRYLQDIILSTLLIESQCSISGEYFCDITTRNFLDHNNRHGLYVFRMSTIRKNGELLWRTHMPKSRYNTYVRTCLCAYYMYHVRPAPLPPLPADRVSSSGILPSDSAFSTLYQPTHSFCRDCSHLPTAHSCARSFAADASGNVSGRCARRLGPQTVWWAGPIINRYIIYLRYHSSGK